MSVCGLLHDQTQIFPYILHSNICYVLLPQFCITPKTLMDVNASCSETNLPSQILFILHEKFM